MTTEMEGFSPTTVRSSRILTSVEDQNYFSRGTQDQNYYSRGTQNQEIQHPPKDISVDTYLDMQVANAAKRSPRHHFEN